MLKKSSTRTDSFLRNNLSVEINFCVLFFLILATLGSNLGL